MALSVSVTLTDTGGDVTAVTVLCQVSVTLVRATGGLSCAVAGALSVSLHLETLVVRHSSHSGSVSVTTLVTLVVRHSSHRGPV